MPPLVHTRPIAASSLVNLFSRCQLHPATTTTTTRAFTTTAPQLTKTIKSHLLPSRLIPPYPYGPRLVYKQSNRGLYGNARIRFGNVVAPRYKNKSQRFWRPNVRVKNYHSPSLGARIKTRLTLRVLKTIKKEGGLENYLLKSKPARIKELGPGGWNLRWLLMQTRAVQERFNEERLAMGLEPKVVEDRDDIIQYAMDFATPGKLSQRSQSTLEELKALSDESMAGFVLGEAELADPDEALEELTDEMEAELLEKLEEEDGQFKEKKDTLEA